jgi:hypothetical protein
MPLLLAQSVSINRTEHGGGLISPIRAAAISLNGWILIQTSWFALRWWALEIFVATPEHSRRFGFEAVCADLTIFSHEYL